MTLETSDGEILNIVSINVNKFIHKGEDLRLKEVPTLV